jgi:hypothetical protein
VETKRRGKGRPGITVEDVERACEALKQQGRVPSPTTVRLELGVGSYASIIKHLRALGYGPPKRGRPK